MIFFYYHKEGYLSKKFSNSWCGFKKRWFVLRNNKLYYYKNEKSLRPSGVLDLDIINMNLYNIYNFQIIFYIYTFIK
ncbi:hypothetical protein PFNF54_04550 [Plasmodium falciparum NF54]|uniref:PH domain-containing protein n=1 Tax=Plasmodium falciparum (isolate NF54) TaxID=5843 RepID=W7JZR8_PLAFO|nr:hypothetical protein PFNF54_04550 [Plasmodium falciparum NF54]